MALRWSAVAFVGTEKNYRRVPRYRFQKPEGGMFLCGPRPRTYFYFHPTPLCLNQKQVERHRTHRNLGTWVTRKPPKSRKTTPRDRPWITHAVPWLVFPPSPSIHRCGERGGGTARISGLATWQPSSSSPSISSFGATLTLPPETVPARALEFWRNEQEARCHASGTAPSKSSPNYARPRWSWAAVCGRPRSARSLGVSEQTYYRWRKEYGGLRLDQAKRLKALEQENTQLKTLVADQALDNMILKEVASGNF